MNELSKYKAEIEELMAKYSNTLNELKICKQKLEDESLKNKRQMLNSTYTLSMGSLHAIIGYTALRLLSTSDFATLEIILIVIGFSLVSLIACFLYFKK